MSRLSRLFSGFSRSSGSNASLEIASASQEAGSSAFSPSILPRCVRSFFSLSSSATSSSSGSPVGGLIAEGFKSSHLGDVQVRYNKREMRRLYKDKISYPEHVQPKRFQAPGWHPSWENRFKVNLVDGKPTVLNRRPGFRHNLYGMSNNQLRWARKWVPTPEFYVANMKKLGFRITTSHKQKTDRPRPFVPS